MKFSFYWQNDWTVHGIFQVLPCVTLMYDDYPQSARRMWTVQVGFLNMSASVAILVGRAPDSRNRALI